MQQHVHVHVHVPTVYIGSQRTQYLLDHKSRHMHHKVHLGDNAVVWIELTEVIVVVTDQSSNVSGLVLCNLWAKQVVYNLHPHQKVVPVFITIRNKISDQHRKNPAKQPHLCSQEKQISASIMTIITCTVKSTFLFERVTRGMQGCCSNRSGSILALHVAQFHVL